MGCLARSCRRSRAAPEWRIQAEADLPILFAAGKGSPGRQELAQVTGIPPSGRVGLIELKLPGRPLSGRQRRRQANLQGLGQDAAAEVLEPVGGWLREARP